MHTITASSSRLLLAFGLIGTSLFAAAQTAPSAGTALPATAPTLSVSDLPSAHPGTLPYQQRAPIGATAVQWDGASMTIHATGEDLPGILSEVVRATGLKVTGGVPDERVFGVYGPGPLQQVLADLFSGLYVNLLLVDGTATQPKELILTPRTGGPTPPSPARTIEASDQQPRHNDRPYRGTPPPGFGAQQGQSNPPASTGAALAPGANANTNTTPDASGQPQSPNGVRTPEQIFQELQRRQAAQQAGTPGQ